MRSIESMMMGLGILLVIGCGDPPADTDGGLRVDASTDDAGDTGDAGTADAGEVPGDGGSACTPACGAGEACFQGVCVASCGGALALPEGAVAEGLTIVANVCRTVTGPLDVVEGDDGAVRIYDLASASVGTTTTFTLSRWTLDDAVTTPTVEVVATTAHAVDTTDVLTFASGYVAVDPTESAALFGYTTSELGAIGGIFDVEVGDGSMSELEAAGNFDATWIDANRWIVNGQGLEGAKGTGQGLWLRDREGDSSTQLATEMGAYSGSVEVLEDVIVAGAFGTEWPEGSPGNRIFVIDRAEALAATAPVSAWDDAVARLEGPSGFELLSGSRIASVRYDDSFAIEAFEVRALTESGGTWTLGAPSDLTGPGITDVVSLPGDRLLLVHANGVLIVQE